MPAWLAVEGESAPAVTAEDADPGVTGKVVAKLVGNHPDSGSACGGR